ncbi:hypothetical protein J6590_023889 [Homalodisca vitripennis]|nr:hypothetical protein J6590_023889 [Homalodisca vitripennis]
MSRLTTPRYATSTFPLSPGRQLKHENLLRSGVTNGARLGSAPRAPKSPKYLPSIWSTAEPWRRLGFPLHRNQWSRSTGGLAQFVSSALRPGDRHATARNRLSVKSSYISDKLWFSTSFELPILLLNS